MTQQVRRTRGPHADFSAPRQAEHQHGVFTRQQALASGLSESQVHYRISTGRWLPILGRGLALAGQEIGFLQRAAAACLTWPDAYLWGPSALTAWRLTDSNPFPVEETPTLHMAVPWSRSPVAGLQQHRLVLPREQRCEDHGLRIQHPDQAVIDGLAALTLELAEQFAAWLITRHRLGAKGFAEAMVSYKGRPGSPQLAKLSEFFESNAASHGELLAHRLLKRHGITGWQANATIVLKNNRWLCVDIYFKEIELVVEIDGRIWHGGEDAFESDRNRDAELIASGYKPLRFTVKSLIERPDYVVTTLRQAIAELSR